MTIPLLGQCLIDKNQEGFQTDALRLSLENHSRASSRQHHVENLCQTSMAFSIVSDLDYFDEAMKV